MRRLFSIQHAIAMGLGLWVTAAGVQAAPVFAGATAVAVDSGGPDKGTGNANGATGDVIVPDGTMVIAPAALDALTKVGTTKVGARVGPRKGGAAVSARGGAPSLLRTGFRAKDQGGEVSLQTSGAVELQARPTVGDNAAVFLLKRCRAVRRTDRLPLETRFFTSPVTRVSVRQRGADLEVVVALRGPVTPVTRMESGPSGSSVWVLEFPPIGTARTATAAAIP